MTSSRWSKAGRVSSRPAQLSFSCPKGSPQFLQCFAKCNDNLRRGRGAQGEFQMQGLEAPQRMEVVSKWDFCVKSAMRHRVKETADGGSPNECCLRGGYAAVPCLGKSVCKSRC